MARNIEDQIQMAIFNYWRLKDGGKKSYMYSVPNGGSRNKLEAVKLKRTGQTAGVADITLLVNGKTVFIEVKIPEVRVRTIKKNGDWGSKIAQRKGKQSDAQIAFQEWVEANGFDYHIVYSVDDFIKVYDTYI